MNFSFASGDLFLSGCLKKSKKRPWRDCTLAVAEGGRGVREGLVTNEAGEEGAPDYLLEELNKQSYLLNTPEHVPFLGQLSVGCLYLALRS